MLATRPCRSGGCGGAGSTSWGHASYAFAAALSLCASLACGEPGSPARARPLSLLWISLDTLRADHLGSYGYARDTSPFLDSLAARGIFFEWAIAPQNSTLPSHISMFTGIHPVVHGVMHSEQNPGVTLAPGVRSLTEVLRDRGFATRGFADGGKLERHFGFGRGFERYVTTRMPFPERLRLARAELDSLPDEQPFFLFIHTYSLHAPYDPEPPYDTLFRAREPRSQALRSLDLYDGLIREVDDQLRGFLEPLAADGRLSDTVVTITSDHGESFAEYGIDHIGHGGHNLHQNVTRVPWIVLHPDPVQRGNVPELVGLIDFGNTMLGLLGVDERLPGGVDVLGAGRGAHRSYLSFSGEAWSMYEGGMHLLESATRPGPERNVAYRVGTDPQERERLDPEEAASLRSGLHGRRNELLAERERRMTSLRTLAPLPETTRRQLEALGYLQGADDESSLDAPAAR
jgi:arylsulfatase A-like enzyme